MRKIAWMSLWPGLAALWLRGSVGGLAAAAVFAAILNFALVATFAWPHLQFRGVSPWVTPAAAWVLVLWFWIIAARSAAKILAQEAARQSPPDDEANRLLAQAQTEYLKGHLSEAERLLTQILETHPGDVEARLLLATLCRRSGREEKAEQQFKELIDLPQAAAWRMEIANELKVIRGERTLTRAA